MESVNSMLQHKSVDILQWTCYQQANIKMSLYGLATACSQHVCCKVSTDFLQVCCLNLLSTDLLLVVSTSYNKSAKLKVATSLILIDMLELDEIEKFVVTCCNNVVKLTNCNESGVFGFVVDHCELIDKLYCII